MTSGIESVMKPVYEALNGVMEAFLKVPSRTTNLYIKELLAKVDIAIRLMEKLNLVENPDEKTVGELLEFALQAAPTLPVMVDGQVRIAGDAVVDATDGKSLTFGYKDIIAFGWESSERTVSEGNIVIETHISNRFPDKDYFDPSTLLTQTWGSLKERVEALKSLEMETETE